ncbi:MAG TPA: triose-phosphate isomerase [Phycisphaerae bacterium]|nr:triose-phosphate isomerase [Phycisphaerae bacterium]
MRKPFVAGNWKMNLTAAEAFALIQALAAKASHFGDTDVAVIPPFVYLGQVKWAIKDAPIQLGAQDVYFENNGAFTGEISASMLLDVGCKYVLIGHSERRHVLGETDALCNKKLLAAVNAGLTAILCVGEKIEERQANKTFDICKTQLAEGLKNFDKSKANQLVIAYEPVWAIGTGLTATKEQAQEVHAFVRRQLAKIFDQPTADSIRIQYGGSVKASNAAELLAQPDVDGALVGGASLKPDEFLAIISAAKHH